MNKAKVLVADDDKIIRDLFKRFLGKQGYEVLTATDGFEALNKIKDDNCDMLILDLKMPRMHGMQLLDEIKQSKKDLIIIIITGYATVDTAKKAIKEGCFDYITKPFDIEEVNIIVKRAFEIRKLDGEKKKLQEQIQVTERLAALAEMGAGVAHEVNTVLAPVKLFLEMLKPKLSPAKDGKNISLILEEVERVEKLVVRFLKFTKPTETEFIKTDINRIIKRGLQFLKYRLKKQNIKVFKKLSQELPQISCDPARMEEVFLNVFSNGIEAMPEGGALTIRSRIAGKNIAIIISDTGTGVSSENIEKLYNPFFTTKAHGTGLGLSIVHRVINEHNGAVKITSEKNKGTTVRIELPMYDKE